MPGLSFLGWIIIGGLAGWVASKIKGTDAQQGILLNIIVGVLGGLLIGWLLGFFFDVAAGGWIFSFFTCLLGAVILLSIVQAVRK
ncbi:Transglycosylase associated protein [Corynebacterium atrinae]|uniref:GlsB/YeaQ/YmgE family stress response membrane protein n=1 Tax=Corynebacterium atrinae TaxID=1336740 RepID=UPI0025B40966|nr:GlsB/YeaQ/YmgE family stress response membrane protein [Corynebacterium atrinae]WJY64580.1 Transglycosylase associated protein [Corynebacterium atrinae]